MRDTPMPGPGRTGAIADPVTAADPPAGGGPGSGGWVIEVADDPIRSDVDAARLVVTDGLLGTQSFSEVGPRAPGADCGLRVEGIYGTEPPGRLLSAPIWTPTGWHGLGRGWSLDLGIGLLTHRIGSGSGSAEAETFRWAIAGEPGCQAFLAPASLGPPSQPDAGPDSDSGSGSGSGSEFGPDPAGEMVPIVVSGADGRVAVVAVVDRTHQDSLLRVACVRRAASEAEAADAARAGARRLANLGPGELLGRQRSSWMQRWDDCSIRIDGDPEADLRTRFALHHLLALGDHGGTELAWGARGLSGEAYGGHVFWDTDVFVVPALANTVPAAARAMLVYRVNRLESARRMAASVGAEGARFPWESAVSGADVTPDEGTTPTGEKVPITTGERELHISADVVWALDTYHLWTGDESLWAEGGAEVAVEVARFWAARLAGDPAGPGHLTGVIGPDEYHELVDDNAFTNRMVSWCLTLAAGIVADGRWLPPVGRGPEVTDEEARRWRGLADGFDPSTRRHLQFAGYDELETIFAASIAEPPFPADLLLGADVVRRSQLIKQADVLMAHHLIPDGLPAGSLEADVAFYLPRTSHGSSLSPAVHASVLARAGRADEALRWYRVALGVDLDDLTGTGTGGLHYATLAGVWQAMVGGFMGLRPTGKGLVVDPQLPSSWSEVELRCQYRGSGLLVRADRHRVEVEVDGRIVSTGRRY